jgi:8-oxo-dGTP pyrophosphatase MutT (NUDIX family)
MRPEEFTAGAEPKPPRAVRPKDAATLLLWRNSSRGLEVLMGVRSAGHRFMPNRLVFPGGRVDPGDRAAPAAAPLNPTARAMLERRAPPRLAHALAAAAARELEEETGLSLGAPPDLSVLDYLCRAVTPPISPVRFDARFLAAPAEAARGTPCDSRELERLGWFTLEDALAAQPAPITARVLGEFAEWAAMSAAEREARPLVWYQGRDTRRFER